METENWNGGERRKDERRSRVYRKMLVGWIIVFSLVSIYSIVDNRSTSHEANKNSQESHKLTVENTRRINEIRASKAALSALQRTNCGLLKFLLTARKARWETYKKSGDKDNLQAVIGYENLAGPFLNEGSTGKCFLPKKILISGRPLATRGG